MAEERQTRARRTRQSQKPTQAEPGEFHEDVGLVTMYEWEDRNEKGELYRLVVDESVIIGILDHAYSDAVNEVIGHLGGTYDEKLNLVHVKFYMSSERVISSLAPDSVEASFESIHEASLKFQEQGALYVGWYHSHPKIKPFPSRKDVAMQADTQLQIPYSVGIICSINNDDSEEGTKTETNYINAFRTAEIDGDIEAILVPYRTASCSHTPGWALKEMIQTIQRTFSENKATHTSILSSEVSSAGKFFCRQDYHRYLHNLLQTNIVQAKISIEIHQREISDEIRKLQSDCEQKEKEVLDELVSLHNTSSQQSVDVEQLRARLKRKIDDIIEKEEGSDDQPIPPVALLSQVMNVRKDVGDGSWGQQSLLPGEEGSSSARSRKLGN